MGVVTDVDVAQGGQSFSKLFDGAFVSFDFIAIGVFAAPFLFCVEAQVFKQYNPAPTDSVDCFLDFLAHAIVREDDLFPKQFLQFGNNGFHAVLRVAFAIRAAQVGHEYDRFGSMFCGVLDGGQGADNTLIVGDVAFFVKGNIEVDLEQWFHVVNYERYASEKPKCLDGVGLSYPYEDSLPGQIHIRDGEFVG